MSEDEYASSSAMWESALAQGRARARERGVDAEGVLRRLVCSRFLARVFASPDSPLVLKGGTAALQGSGAALEHPRTVRTGEHPRQEPRVHQPALQTLGIHAAFARSCPPLSQRGLPHGGGAGVLVLAHARCCIVWATRVASRPAGEFNHRSVD